MDRISELWNAAMEHWIILTLLFLVLAIYWHYVITFTILKKLGLRGPTPLPILGNMLEFFWQSKSLHIIQCKARKIYGKIYGIYMFKTPTVVVSDPEILKIILVKEFQKFHDRVVCMI